YRAGRPVGNRQRWGKLAEPGHDPLCWLPTPPASRDRTARGNRHGSETYAPHCRAPRRPRDPTRPRAARPDPSGARRGGLQLSGLAPPEPRLRRTALRGRDADHPRQRKLASPRVRLRDPRAAPVLHQPARLSRDHVPDRIAVHTRPGRRALTGSLAARLGAQRPEGLAAKTPGRPRGG